MTCVPVACVAWTVTHEELFREAHDWLIARSQSGRSTLERKFFYMLTCEFCFSHYVAAGLLAVTRFHLLYTGWLGYFIAAPWRRLWHDPRTLLEPFITEGMTVLDVGCGTGFPLLELAERLGPG